MSLAQCDSAGGRFRDRSCAVVAILTACAVFPLIVVGAGVTSKDAGMAYADWPTSAGHLVNPPNWLEQDDTRWEHGHRLIGWTVGMCAIATAVLAWPKGGWTRRLAVITLLAIILQGVLGGMRVREISTSLAMMHGIWGHVCFCLAGSTALICSRGWGEQKARTLVVAATFLRRLCVTGTVLVFVQLTLGAAYRHFGSNVFLIAHILWAIVVSFVVGWIAMWIMGLSSTGHILRKLGRILAGLMAGQLMLGALAFVVVSMNATTSPTVRWLAPTAHVAVGALLLVGCLLTLLCSCHMLEDAPRRRPVIEGVAAEPS